MSVLISPALPTLALPGVSFLPHGAHTLPPIAAAPAAAPPEPRQDHALLEAKTKLLKERERGLQLTLDRRAFDVLNCVSVVPGAVGAWRRDLILRAGGFTHETLAEDTDLTLTIRRHGYAIVYEDEAIALTEAPDTVRGFIRQRYRWMFGTMQATWKHRNVLFRRRYGALGFVALPNVLIFQVLFPLVSPVMDLVLIGSLLIAGFDHAQHPDQYSPDALWRVLFYYALFLAVDFLAAALAFALEPTENKWLLVWLVWQRFFYRQLMYYVAIKATLASLRGAVVGWAKLERKATVVQA